MEEQAGLLVEERNGLMKEYDDIQKIKVEIYQDLCKKVRELEAREEVIKVLIRENETRADEMAASMRLSLQKLDNQTQVTKHKRSMSGRYQLMSYKYLLIIPLFAGTASTPTSKILQNLLQLNINQEEEEEEKETGALDFSAESLLEDPDTSVAKRQKIDGTDGKYLLLIIFHLRPLPLLLHLVVGLYDR